jgi:hypothetical protein
MTTFENAIKDQFISKISNPPSGYQFKFQPSSNGAFHVILNHCALNISFGNPDYAPRGMAATLWAKDVPQLMSFYTICESPIDEYINTCKWVETPDEPLETGILTSDMISRLIDNLVEVASKITTTTSTIRIRPAEVLEPAIEPIELLAPTEENRDKLFITIYH